MMQDVPRAAGAVPAGCVAEPLRHRALHADLVQRAGLRSARLRAIRCRYRWGLLLTPHDGETHEHPERRPPHGESLSGTGRDTSGTPQPRGRSSTSGSDPRASGTVKKFQVGILAAGRVPGGLWSTDVGRVVNMERGLGARPRTASVVEFWNVLHDGGARWRPPRPPWPPWPCERHARVERDAGARGQLGMGRRGARAPWRTRAMSSSVSMTSRLICAR